MNIALLDCQKMKLYLKSCDLWEIVETSFHPRVQGSYKEPKIPAAQVQK